MKYTNTRKVKTWHLHTKTGHPVFVKGMSKYTTEQMDGNYRRSNVNRYDHSPEHWTNSVAITAHLQPGEPVEWVQVADTEMISESF
jgi:hypothetical protein